MKQPKIANEFNINGLQQTVRIYGVTILANLIKIQKPAQDFATCKMQALEQLQAAVSQDWQA